MGPRRFQVLGHGGATPRTDKRSAPIMQRPADKRIGIPLSRYFYNARPLRLKRNDMITLFTPLCHAAYTIQWFVLPAFGNRRDLESEP